MPDQRMATPPASPTSTKPRLTYAIQMFDATGPMRPPYLVMKGFTEAGWEVGILTMEAPGNAGLMLRGALCLYTR